MPAGSRKNHWKEYRGSLTISYLFAFVSVLFLSRTPWANKIPVALYAGFVFGTLFFGVGFLFSKVKYRSFWLAALVRTGIIG